MPSKRKQAPVLSPRTANERHYRGALERLRLLLRREILWRRTEWKGDQLGDLRGLAISDAQADRLLEGGRAAARARFLATDPECIAIGQAVGRLGDEVDAFSRTMSDAGAAPALDRLSGTFGLTPFERDTLLLAAAPALDETFGPLLAYAQDSADAPFATPQLAIALLTDSHHDAELARDALSPNARLRKRRLVSVEAMPPRSVLSSPMHIDERVVDYVRGINACDGRVAAILQDLPSIPLPAPFASLAEQIATWVSRRANQGIWPLVNLVDDGGAGGRDVALGACRRLGLRLAELDAAALASSTDAARDDALRLLEREAALLHAAYLVSAESRDGSPSRENALAIAERLASLIIVVSPTPVRSDRETLSLSVPRIAPLEQRECWTDALSDDAERLGDAVAQLADQFSFAPREIHRAVSSARSRAELDAGAKRGRRGGAGGGGAAVSFDHLWSAARDEAGRLADDLLQHVQPAHSLDDLVLPLAVRAQIEELAAQVKHRTRVYEAWGFGARLSRGRATSACFAGPTGCGKSAAAEALSTLLQLPLYRVDLAGVSSKYIGDTEKNLRRVFDAAEQSGAILFFDEADALFGKRTDVKDSHDRYANIEVNYLLQRLEDYRGLGILATNRKTAIDRAFLRRLRFLVDFPFPDVDSRRRIWRQVFPPEALVGALDYERLAQMEIAGGNIKNIAVNAAFLAAADNGGSGRPISMRHVLRAAEREYAKIDKALGGPELAMPREAVGA